MLEPEVLAHLHLSEPEDAASLGPTERRLAASRSIDRVFRQFGLAGPRVDLIVDHEVPVDHGSILLRSYHPDSRNTLPAHIYLHGGGWTTGSIHELVCDATARHRAVSCECVTILVEYRLAPEFPFPTAVHDVVAAARWVDQHAHTLGIDPQQVTLGGASAGANLAVAAVLAGIDLDLRALLLEVPALDLRDAGAVSIPGDIDDADARWIRPMCDAYQASVAAYLTDPAEAISPLATPLLAPDLSMMPETFILTAELDALRPGAEQFAERLEEAGVPTHIRCYPGALHGSPILNATWATARRWHDDTLAILRRVNAHDPHMSI